MAMQLIAMAKMSMIVESRMEKAMGQGAWGVEEPDL